MQVDCEHCGRQLNLPEEKLPQAPRFSFTCPSCGNTVRVERSEKGASSAAKQGAPPSASEAPPELEEDEYFPAGADVLFAFVRDSQWQAGVKRFAQQHGFFMAQSAAVEQAVLKLRYNSYRVMIVEQGPEAETLLAEIGRIQGMSRRQSLCVLISPETANFDPYESFWYGVDCCLRREDSGQAVDLLEQAYAAFLRRIEPWQQAAQQMEAGRT